MRSPGTELKTRAISGIVLGVAVLFITWWHPTSFIVMSLLGAAVLGREWWGLTRHRHWLFVPLGILYIGAGVSSLIYLRTISDDQAQGAYLVFLLLGLVWASDIGGYLLGKPFGKHKIWPRVSPGKSWEGLAGSILLSSSCLLILQLLMGAKADWESVAFALVVGTVFSIIGLLGDLFESALKRHAGVKDSGRLIPGHGGLFDRIDALLPCAVVLALTVLLLNLSLHGEFAQ